EIVHGEHVAGLQVDDRGAVIAVAFRVALGVGADGKQQQREQGEFLHESSPPESEFGRFGLIITGFSGGASSPADTGTHGVPIAISSWQRFIPPPCSPSRAARYGAGAPSLLPCALPACPPPRRLPAGDSIAFGAGKR